MLLKASAPPLSGEQDCTVDCVSSLERRPSDFHAFNGNRGVSYANNHNNST